MAVVNAFYSVPKINHPNCSECGVTMWLAQIEPDNPKHDKLTFACPVCRTWVCEIVGYQMP